ncbi:type I CRISPR-associated protein Cas7 [Skermanella pratensis]|uniref:type I CRISPR-associated protein Cas7 n=1 Tax=Skermanella pratensis TaxID=2233999 RepID=UPI00130188B6|nr:type I CRISPR-associated protein Cas7 [Skermanella pratensis]
MPEFFNRGTGLLIIEVRCSNPNGDPDQESEPRTLSTDGRGLISPVSFKRKLRDLVEDADGPVARKAFNLSAITLADGVSYRILESRGRDRESIGKLNPDAFKAAFWDARVFGNTFLESMKDDGKDTKGKGKKDSRDHFISTGVVQFGPGLSVAPVEIERLTTTNKSGVEDGKDRGMAPLAWRVVQHGVYAMPFFVNPMAARKTGCSPHDIELLKFLIPHAYRATASAIRPFVEIRHAWFAEHGDPLGSCPDYLIIDALTPRKVGGRADAPSRSIEEYQVPDALPDGVRSRVKSFEDLCLKSWA